MFGSGILKGLGVTFKHLIETYSDDVKKIPSRYAGLNGNRQFIDQPWDEEGLFTIQYPEEKRVIPERFRFIPMLLWDTAKGEDRCTACGICAKVCPPQCIWIVRDKDEKGKPVTRPAEFYIDASICMSCSYCAEFCPFDAIKMNHDYELAAFERYPRLIYDKEMLTVPIEYYARLWPVQYAEEEAIRAAEEEAKRKQAEEKAKAAAAKAAAAAAPSATPTPMSAAAVPAARPKMTPEEIEARKAEVAARRAGQADAAPAAEAAPTPAAAPAARPKMTPEEIEARKAEVAARRAGQAAPTPTPEPPAAPAPEPPAAASPNVTRPRMTPEEIEARKAEVAARRAGLVAPVAAAPIPLSAVADDIELIEGIGPKIGAAFRAAGVSTFKHLAETPVERMKEILAAANLRADPSTWAEQAALAAAGKMDELKHLQDALVAGRRA